MNHLCGLSDLGDTLPDLTSSERDALSSFRRRYEAHYFDEEDSSTNATNDDSNEEKKEISTHSCTPILTQPAYEISSDELDESGLRPLDDVSLYRYLTADRLIDGSFDVEASYKRLLDALRFRKQHRCDNIVKNIATDTTPPTTTKCQRLRVGIWTGVDYHHRPVVFERLGEFFSSGNATKVSEEDWIESYLYFLEHHFRKMRESAMTSNQPVDRIVYYADFQGVVSSIMNRKIWKVIPLLKSLVKTVECHYPEIVSHITLFNVPRIASAAYKVVRAFLDPVTAGKIELYPGVPLERFRELIGDDVIPVEYGGRNEVDYPHTATD